MDGRKHVVRYRSSATAIVMSYLEAFVLGLVQGLTEFLPVSSSGHLVLTQALLGVTVQGVLFEIMVHVGTLFSVVVYFRRRLWALTQSLWSPAMKDDRQMIVLLALATVPAVIAAVTLGDQLKAVYDMPHITALLLVVTAFLLLLPKLLKLRGNRDVGFVSAIVMGIGQALAILPGISRAGSTITAGLLAKVNPAKAAEFSFLMSIPAIAGGAVFEFRTLLEAGSDAERLGPLLVAAVIAFLSGLAAIYTVLAAIRKGRFAWFSLYLVVAGISGYFYFRG